MQARLIAAWTVCQQYGRIAGARIHGVLQQPYVLFPIVALLALTVWRNESLRYKLNVLEERQANVSEVHSRCNNIDDDVHMLRKACIKLEEAQKEDRVKVDELLVKLDKIGGVAPVAVPAAPSSPTTVVASTSTTSGPVVTTVSAPSRRWYYLWLR